MMIDGEEIEFLRFSMPRLEFVSWGVSPTCQQKLIL